MPDGQSALGRLNGNNRSHVNAEAERRLLGEPEAEPATEITTSTPVMVSSRPHRAGKRSSFESLAASIEPTEQMVPFSVRVPLWLRQAVVEKIKTQQAKGIKLTQDMAVRQALVAFFDLEDPN